MAEQGPPQDPFNPLPRKGESVTAPTLKADEPTQPDTKAPTPSEKRMRKQANKKAPSPSKARDKRGLAVDESDKVTKAAVNATKSDDEIRASDRGPEQAVDTNNQPLSASTGPSFDVEDEQPPKPAEAPAVDLPPLKTKRPVQRKSDQQKSQQGEPDQPQKEQPRDAQASVDKSEQKAESPMKDLTDAIKGMVEVLIEIRNDQRELLYYAREASTQQGGLGSQP